MECLNVQRSADFVSFALENDLQIAINRRSGLTKLRAALATSTDRPETCFEWAAEHFEKIETFLCQNDAQVHYSGTNTVAVYSMVKLLGSLRRTLRDLDAQSHAHFMGHTLVSPTRPGTRAPVTRSPTRRLEFHPAGQEPDTPMTSPRQGELPEPSGSTRAQEAERRSQERS